MAENENGIEMNENVGEVEQSAINPALQKQAELEEHYKNICAQEVLFIEQLKQVQEKRKAVASQLELVKTLVA